HQDIVNDVAIQEEIPSKIMDEHWSGDWAIYKVYETFIKMIKRAPDPLIAERSADFDDVRRRLLKLWYGMDEESLAKLPEPVIVAAKDLLPSDTATMDRANVLAILTETGGPTSHSAIIAKSYGIPAVLGIQGLLETAKHGQSAAVNAGEGIVNLDPDAALLSDYAKKSEIFRRDMEITRTFQKKEALTKDNVKIDIGLNIAEADAQELEAADYTDSVGLFRTEFLYMGRDTLPGEDEQFGVYKKVLERFGKRPVILRTLDIGGDKPLSSLELPKEENPFLGNRAIRLCFTYPEIFKTQLRACLRAAVYGNLWVMFPMVGSIDDIRKAKEFVEIARNDLKKEGSTFGEIKTGIMIEIPSIALLAHHAAAEVDFASIGSNDLCQYLCAADRMNSAVEHYYQSYHPALLSLINHAVKAFAKAGKPISVCGELGGDPLITPLLVGIGMRKLSMGAASVAKVKRNIASLTVKKAEEIASRVLEFATAQEIEEYLRRISDEVK
ncbi:MAG: phosphoenolpyruvate--protein phosphotransferase, partial [Treponema sp.]|nr:phosphoenolpyruvate--protein phosphotransferase [Treponema sp.]